jgi:creatinine amidohydrolase/Fe(II)-dependent formamide hydrolase-like protein
LGALLGLQAAAAEPAAIALDDMTWTEVQRALKAGSTTVIIPIGGTEQSGPHMALGKHNSRVKVLAGRIASRLGHTLVAPVIAYVPEGGITPPQGHMRFVGTLSVSSEAFGGIIDGAARSLKQHGFKDIVLIGDHGGYQPQLKTIAARLNREWSATPVRVHFIEDYYRVTQTAYVEALRAKGLSEAQIGTHAGTADTALLMALDASMVQPARFEEAAKEGPASGTVGDPRKATAALGEIGVELIVTRTVDAIKAAQARH